MTSYRDLTDYEYHREFARPGTKNVGWLAGGHEFDTAEPTEELLGELWNFCKVSVAQSRGVHECDFCPGRHSQYAERDGERLLLGTAEIRVFPRDGGLYAAPTLVYHYVREHRYRPPVLTKLGLKWRNTPAPQRSRVAVNLRPSDR